MPYVRNGHTWIANELIEQVFAKGKFSKRESQIIWVILRESWGWLDKRAKTIKRYGEEKRKYLVTRHPIFQLEFSGRTGLAVPHICSTIKDLIDQRIIRTHWNYYKFNKNYESYQPKTGKTQIRQVLSINRISDTIKSLERRIRGSYVYKLWRENVLARDDYTCQKCQTKMGYGIGLLAHHKEKRFAQILLDNKIDTYEKAMNCAELWNVEKGETLCSHCHSLISHRKGDFTPITKKVINSPITKKVKKDYQNGNEELLKRLKNITKTVTSTAPKGKPKKKQRGLKESKERLNKERNMILSQIENLLSQFPPDIKEMVKEYTENARLENKTQRIGLQKRRRLINELHLVWTGCDHPILQEDFRKALRITNNKQVPNINYVKKVMEGIVKKRSQRIKGNGHT